MSIYHAIKSNNFCQISNSLATDPNISFKAKGIMLYLLSKPTDWKTYEKDITAHTTDGRESVRTGINELISAGYIVRDKARNKGGKFEGYNYSVFESIEMAKSVEKTTVVRKPDNGLSDNGKLNTTNTELTNTNVTKTKRKGKPSSLQLDGHSLTKEDLTEETKELIRYFFKGYKSKTGKVHPKLNMKWATKVQELAQSETVWDADHDRELMISYDSLFDMIDLYFETDYPLNDGGYADHKIYHFLSDGVLMVLAYRMI